MKIISSVHNQEIKDVAALKSSKARTEQGRFIAEGERVISTFIQSGWRPTMIYATEKTFAEAEKLVASEQLTCVASEVMYKMSQASTPSELLAIFRIPVAPDLKSLTPGLVLANLADPGNVGTLMRTCAAMNAKSVIVVEGVDPWHPKVIQASAGTIATLNIFEFSWSELLASKGDLKLYALAVAGGKPLETVDAHNALLVVGNEAQGLSSEMIADCDETITISMPGNTESLNAAVAGSIALYSVFKTS